ncbi:MAG: hypothetical protein JO156_10815 [Solirubrobacterales bacterium]|nr:hypothetical protein [Solirubrobacterales bacterium]
MLGECHDPLDLANTETVPARRRVSGPTLPWSGNRAAFERDRRRDQILTAHGYRVIRITWRQLTREPFAVVVRVAAALHA